MNSEQCTNSTFYIWSRKTRKYLAFSCLFLCFVVSRNVYAPPPSATSPPINLACDATTDYTLANLNEIKSKGGASNPTVEFVEVKILVDNTDISGWEICFSDNPTKELCTEMGVGNGTWYTTTQTSGLDDDASTHPMGSTYFDANTWITYIATNVKADAGEVLLRSSVGAESGGVVLDYIRYDNTPGICGDGNERWNITDDNGGSGLDVTVWPTGAPAEPDDYTACSACFDARDSSQKDFGRNDPDGDGDWGNNGDEPTEGSTNDTSTGGGFSISVFSPGSTCSTDATSLGLALRELIIIEAVNSGGNTITNFDGIINLTTSNNNGNWYTTDGTGASVDLAQGTLTDTVSDDNGAASYDFDSNDDGFVALYLDNQHAETLTITVVDSTDSATSSTSSNLTFSDNVFVVNVNEPSAPFNNPPDSLTPVAGRPHQLQIQMMRRDTSLTPNDCGVASGYNVGDIKAWITRNADDPGGVAPSLITTAETQLLIDTEPGATNLTLSFANGSANFSLITADVGKYLLNFKDDTNGFADVDIISDPISLTVRPFGFDIDSDGQRADDWSDSPLALDGTGPSGINSSWASSASASQYFAKAGHLNNTFPVTIRAVLWESADDNNDDGVPDSAVNLTDNGLTPSFGQEGVSNDTELVDITVSNIRPTSVGSLYFGNDLDFLTNGTLTTNLAFDQVGVIDLVAALNSSDYLGSGVNVTTTHQNFGRFAPDRLSVIDDNSPSFANACSLGGSPFTYQDQSFYFGSGTAPALTIRAVNENGDTTSNYGDTSPSTVAGRYWKLTSNLSRTYTDQAVAAATFNDVQAVTVNLNGDLNYDGEGIFSLDDLGNGDAFSYSRVSEEAEFTANVDLLFSATALTDSDGICYDPDNHETCDSYTISSIGGAALRFGRLIIENAVGSELLPLALPMKTQYFDGSNYIDNIDDSCMELALTDLVLSSAVETNIIDGDIDVSNGASCIGSGVTTASLTLPRFADGDSGLSFTAPGEACVGYVDTTMDLSAISLTIGSLLYPDLTFLQYDWDDDLSFDDNPTGRATFGVFSGQSEFIYIREPW